MSQAKTIASAALSAMQTNPFHKYSRIGSSEQSSDASFETESEKGLLEQSKTFDDNLSIEHPQFTNNNVHSSHSRFTWASVMLNLILGGFSVAYIFRGYVEQGKLNHSLKATSGFSPVLANIDIPLSMVRMNASFVPEYPISIYRQDPSPEVDAAWVRLANTNPIAVTEEEAIKSGWNILNSAKYNQEFGFGPDAYIGRIDVFHQLHCLDALRKETNFMYYYGEKFPDGKASEAHRAHTSHCLYLLLQNIMCTANVDLYSHNWIDTQNLPFPDFSIEHKCRDFETILKWQEDHSVDLDVYMQKIKKPVDARERITSDEYKRLTGYDPVTGLSNGHSG